MGNTTFNGPVRSQNGFEDITVAASTGAETTNSTYSNNASIGGTLAVTQSITGKKSINTDFNASSANGDAQTESITGANAGTATGAKYFKTIASITAVGNPAGNVSAGVNASAADVVFAGRSRLKGVYLTSTATAGTVDFLTTSPSGTSIMGLSSVGDADATRDVVIPENGVVFSSGIYMQYTVSTFLTLTVFHA